MSNPGLGKCINCKKPIERRSTNMGLVWVHRATGHTLCNPSSIEGVDTWAVPR